MDYTNTQKGKKPLIRSNQPELTTKIPDQKEKRQAKMKKCHAGHIKIGIERK